MKAIDIRLNVHPQAWAILHLLSDMDFTVPSGVDITTSAFYGGRERGVVVTVDDWARRIGPRGKFHVFFAEARGSDQIMVIWWRDPPDHVDINPPKAGDIPDDAWKTSRKYFGYADTMRAAEHVRDLIADHLSKGA